LNYFSYISSELFKFAILQMTILKHSLWISFSKTGNF